MESAHAVGHEVIKVAVPGGMLAVETFGSATEPVLAIHGARAAAELIAAALS